MQFSLCDIVCMFVRTHHFAQDEYEEINSDDDQQLQQQLLLSVAKQE